MKKKRSKRNRKKGKWTKTHGAPTKRDLDRLLWAAHDLDREVRLDPT